MGFIEEEDQLRFIQVPDFRKVLIELGQEGQEHSGVQGWLVEELFRIENVDNPTAIAVLAHEVGNLQAWLTKEVGCPLLL